MIALVVVGAGGRMGQAVLARARAEGGFEIAAGIEQPAHPDLGRPAGPDRPPLVAAWPEALPPSAVVVDFSTPGALAATAAEVIRLGRPWICGVTGVVERAPLERAAAALPVVHAPNMSIGVNLLYALAKWLRRRLPVEFDAEIVETHHRRKADAPSGTARRLAEILDEVRPARLVHGRQGITGPRAAGEIGIHALRLGGVVGEHELRFASDLEEISVRHRAFDRGLFAGGALAAARWALAAGPGLYGMADVLGLET